MSTTGETLGPFLLSRSGDGVIGFDGIGAIDFSNSTLVTTPRQAGGQATFGEEAFLAVERNPIISMRRGVKPFDLFFDWKFNILLVRPEVAEDYGPWIENSAAHLLSEVTCHFGKRSLQYLFGTLRHHDAKNHLVVWPKSCFNIARNREFDVNQTLIGRGELPQDTEIRYTAENLTFSSEKEARNAPPSLNKIIPVKLALRCPPADLIQFSVGQTLISSRLFNAVWNRPRPKSRVAGLIASRPLVEIEFNSTD